ncbi:hypothetical protein Droror1_Dr00010585 [Drosera rotundifolia]
MASNPNPNHRIIFGCFGSQNISFFSQFFLFSLQRFLFDPKILLLLKSSVFFFFFGIQFFFPVRYDQMMESESELICFFLFLAEGVGGVTLMWCQRSSTDQG